MAIAEEAPAPARERWTAQWKELYEEVIDGGLCTGCAGCVIVCPHDVIGYDDTNGRYKPFHLEDELGPNILLTRASDEFIHDTGQDGGFVSAMLIWLLDNDYIDGALTSYLEGEKGDWKAIPGIATTKEEVLKGAGSRYTYSANPMAVFEARKRELSRLALVGMGCQTSSPPVMWHRKVGKSSKPFLFTIGLLCSKSFDDAIFEELFETKYGLRKQDMVKMNIKGVFQIWMRDGSYHEINLKECHAWTREGCNTCPDFAAEHADISTGGIGKFADWTLTVVRTDLGREVMSRMIADGTVVARPGDEDPGAIALMHKLSKKSRERWPSSAVDFPR